MGSFMTGVVPSGLTSRSLLQTAELVRCPGERRAAPTKAGVQIAHMYSMSGTGTVLTAQLLPVRCGYRCSYCRGMRRAHQAGLFCRSMKCKSYLIPFSCKQLCVKHAASISTQACICRSFQAIPAASRVPCGRKGLQPPVVKTFCICKHACKLMLLLQTVPETAWYMHCTTVVTQQSSGTYRVLQGQVI